MFITIGTPTVVDRYASLITKIKMQIIIIIIIIIIIQPYWALHTYFGKC